jgi:hypothetical protein
LRSPNDDLGLKVFDARWHYDESVCRNYYEAVQSGSKAKFPETLSVEKAKQISCP